MGIVRTHRKIKLLAFLVVQPGKKAYKRIREAFGDEFFDDENGVPNISIKDIDGDILVVSQFTLQASTKKGNRPSYIKASKAETAIPIYEKLIKQLENDFGKKIETGMFGADMKVALVNDGPVTIIMDSKKKE